MQTISLEGWNKETKEQRRRSVPRLRFGSGEKTETAVLSQSACDLLGLGKESEPVSYYTKDESLLIVRDPEGPYRLKRAKEGQAHLPLSIFKRHDAYARGEEWDDVQKVQVEGKDGILLRKRESKAA